MSSPTSGAKETETIQQAYSKKIPEIMSYPAACRCRSECGFYVRSFCVQIRRFYARFELN
jgi:hypothetical protein